MGCRAAIQQRESVPQEGGSQYRQLYFLDHTPLQQGLLVGDTGGKCAATPASLPLAVLRGASSSRLWQVREHRAHQGPPGILTARAAWGTSGQPAAEDQAKWVKEVNQIAR